MHNIEYFDYPVKGSNKKTIQSDLNEYVSRQTYQEGGHGIEPIRWIDDDVCADYNAAQARIEHLDNHNYDQLAVDRSILLMPASLMGEILHPVAQRQA